MVKKNLILTALIILTLIPFSYAGDFAYNRLYDGVSEISINQTIINGSGSVNSSEWWLTNIGAADGVSGNQFDILSGLLTLDTSWLQAVGDGWWCALTGCTMSGNLTVNADIEGDTMTLGGVSIDSWDDVNQSSGIWTNVSGVATYQGSANVTGNISVSDRYNFNDTKTTYMTKNELGAMQIWA